MQLLLKTMKILLSLFVVLKYTVAYSIIFHLGILIVVMNATPIITPIMPIHTMLDETGGTMIQEDADMTTMSTGEMDFTV